MTDGSDPALARCEHGPPRHALRRARALRRGRPNPKAVAFFVGLYAVAVPPDTPFWARGVILAAAFVLEACWYALVVASLRTGRVRSLHARFGTWIEWITGTVLIVMGGRLAFGRVSPSSPARSIGWHGLDANQWEPGRCGRAERAGGRRTERR